MMLEIVKYGHPALRKKGESIEAITPEIKKLIVDMFETMAENHGVGLAAQQVGIAKQLAVIDVRDMVDRPSTLELDGEPADPSTIMPLVLINPEITPVSEPVAGPEGCLSFPEIFADISRPAVVDVKALDGKGRPIAVQHEKDHLNGVLFIDRMDKKTKAALQLELDALHAITKAELSQKK
jgi:peptide deformylase